MKVKVLAVLILCIMITTSRNAIARQSNETIPLIPVPKSMQANEGSFIINASTTIAYSDESNSTDVEVFNNSLTNMYGFRLKAGNSTQRKANQINIVLSPEMEENSYRLNIDTNGIFIKGGLYGGVFYALQTLIQLLPPVMTKNLAVPCLSIEDAPRFSYRGMHLDVVRHFFTVKEVERYIDFLALYKFNTFHWHLTDDQGWRIEIKKYPALQKISAWRKGTLIGHAGDKPEKYDSLLYGGFYTQEEIKGIVNYAADRRITIIPEIEMPGHALAALAAYPELSCTGGPFETGRYWGVFEDVFCTKEETFTFLQNVLDEVCGLFPGKYIHIGGDECPKDRWKECPRCQDRIKKENLKDENDLQRYFTNRITSYLKKKGKTTIGWDEILEEGLDSSAVIMSWRGYNGGTLAATKGHDAIMSPASHCYLDMYQSRYTSGRIAIGGYTPLDRVYSFEPVPDVLNTEQAKHIIGAQGNVWTEYIPDESRLQEMIFPRICALSEVLWSPKESRDYVNFTSRLIYQFKMLSYMKIKYSTALYDISTRVSPNGNNGIFVELITSYPRGKIFYTTDGSSPTVNSQLYSGKIPLDQGTDLQAALFEGLQQKGIVFKQDFSLNKATGKEVILANPPHVEYSRGGGFSLVNGVTGGLPWIPSEWLGFLGKDLDATIDLGTVQSVTRVYVDVLKDEAGKIFLPNEVVVSLSENGKDYKTVGTIDSTSINTMNRKLLIDIPTTQARFIKVIAKNSNNKDWLFVDEIVVD